MRILTTAVLLALLTACGDNYANVQAVGTIDAFEQYLADNPGSRHKMAVEAQLETLYLEKARKLDSLEGYDTYLERFPQGDLRAKAIDERETFLFDWAKTTGTSEAWGKFLKEYPRADKKRAAAAKRLSKVAAYRDSLEWTDLVIEPVNLAENPDGPKDGWGFTMEVTNKGAKTLTDLRFTIDYLGPEGNVLDSKEWPLVAKQWPIPMEEEKKVAMKSGETRTWFWSAGGMPEVWKQGARVYPTRISFQE